MSPQFGFQRVSKASQPHAFEAPKKCINDGDSDIPFFLHSLAYADITAFLMQLNLAMFPQQSSEASASPQVFPLNDSTNTLPACVQAVSSIIQEIERLISDIPPDPGPRRFGNISFRRWVERVEETAPTLLSTHLSGAAVEFPSANSSSSLDELKSYFLGGFGSAQRLDYGTGHELSFLAFLGCLWKLGQFDTDTVPGEIERAIVTGILEPYFMLVRKLISTYTLEPAGSHGVWGLDDHCFLPYVLGSAQLSPPIPRLDANFKLHMIPQEGSLQGAPRPSDVTNQAIVERERRGNMYFRAIGFIYDVKKGPFWEHSPVLYDISGITAGWAKINKGMLKMYNAEVLSKFPVVQHFPFGSLFRWENDPDARPALLKGQHVMQSGQRSHNVASSGNSTVARPAGVTIRDGTPTQRPTGMMAPPTTAPWSKKMPETNIAASSGASSMRAPWADTGSKGR